jgi:hypothetical protein
VNSTKRHHRRHRRRERTHHLDPGW